MRNRLFNFAGFSLTPPAFIMNIWEWFNGLDMNQVFTVLISVFVVIFWCYKIKEQRYKARQAEIECERADSL